MSTMDARTTSALLYLDAVSVSFDGFRALNDLSLTVQPGEMRAIIGPNGAGKTSMLNVINGFYTPQQGRITFKGETRAKMRPHEAALGGIAVDTHARLMVDAVRQRVDRPLARLGIALDAGKLDELLAA